MARQGAFLLPGTAFAGFLALWEIAARTGIAPKTVAAPSQIARIIVADRGALWFHLEPTLLTAMIGYLAAVVVALSLGFAVHNFSRAEAAVMTVGSVVDSIPIIAIAPVLIIWLGLSLPTRMIITSIICFFPILVSVIQGLKTQPGNLQDLFTVLAATPLQRFRLFVLPNALPYLFIGLKIAAPLAVLGALVAEWTGAEWGLGVFMINAMFGLRVGELWSAVVLSCALSSGAYGLICLFERLSLSYDRTAE